MAAHGPATRSGAADGAVVVAMIHGDHDRDLADLVSRSLAGAGVTVATDDDSADAVVVILSRAGLADPGWLGEGRFHGRVVPLRVDEIESERVPVALRELNWLDWRADNPAASLGAILAALNSDPSRRDLARELSYQSHAWQVARRPDQMLIHDLGQARRMADLLEEVSADRTSVVIAGSRDFVARSLLVSGRRHRARRRRRVAGVVAVVLAVAAGFIYAPQIQLGGFNNHEAIVTTGEPVLMSELPEWTAANAAALLLNGSPAQRDLARPTLIEALNAPWAISDPGVVNAILNMVVLDRGSHAAVLYRRGPVSAIAVLDIAVATVMWTVDLPAVYWDISVSPDDATALAVGRTGGAVVDLTSHTVRALPRGDAYYSARLMSRTTAVVQMLDGRLGIMHTNEGEVTAPASYESILAIQSTSDGHGVGLVQADPGHFALVDPTTGQMRQSVLVAAPGDPVGGLAPDGEHALVAGADGQFWVFGVGSAPSPTGITVPTDVVGVAWITNDRAVVFSYDRRGEVYYLPRAELIGTVCRDVPRVREVRPSQGSDVIGCFGEGLSAFWRLPGGPLPTRPAGMSSELTAESAGVRVEARDGLARVIGPGTAVTNWFRPLLFDITAVTVSADGTRILIGGVAGDVAIVDRTAESASIATLWRAPDSAAISAVLWRDGPIVATASGQTWAVPDCGRCGTDTDLIDTFRDRFTGCLTERQLSYMDSYTRDTLGIRQCATPIGGL